MCWTWPGIVTYWNLHFLESRKLLHSSKNFISVEEVYFPKCQTILSIFNVTPWKFTEVGLNKNLQHVSMQNHCGCKGEYLGLPSFHRDQGSTHKSST